MTQPTGDLIELRAQPVEEANNYRYRDAQLDVIWHTSVPKDDEAAIAYFHTLMRLADGFRPVYLEKRVKGEDGIEKYEMIRVQFDPDNFTTTDRR